MIAAFTSAALLIATLSNGQAQQRQQPTDSRTAAEIGNEIMDRLSYGGWRLQDTAFDFANTLFWPFVLMVGLRWRRAHETMPGGAARPA